jgi:hypothetical protein
MEPTDLNPRAYPRIFASDWEKRYPEAYSLLGMLKRAKFSVREDKGKLYVKKSDYRDLTEHETGQIKEYKDDIIAALRLDKYLSEFWRVRDEISASWDNNREVTGEMIDAQNAMDHVDPVEDIEVALELLYEWERLWR